MISDDSYSITEAGLIIGINTYFGTSEYILICRDVFSPIAILNGDVIVVRYIFRFNM